MKEGTPKPEFGKPVKKKNRQQSFFQEGEDLPLLSGTPQQAVDSRFVPQEVFKQPELPGMPGIDYDHIREKDKQLRRRRR